MESGDHVGGDSARRRERTWMSGYGVAVACVGVVLALSLTKELVSSSCRPATPSWAKLEIVAICAAIDSYMLANDGRPPESLEVLVTPGADGSTYLKDRTSVPLDPWGNPYCYEPVHGEHGYRVYSLARDGKPGGSGDDADIDNFTIASER